MAAEWGDRSGGANLAPPLPTHPGHVPPSVLVPGAAGDGRPTWPCWLPRSSLLLASLYPFLTGLYTALTNRKLYLPDAEFIGLGNFQTLAATPLFWTALTNTLVYTALAVLIQLPLGMAIALLLDIPSRLQSFLRTALVLPS